MPQRCQRVAREEGEEREERNEEESQTEAAVGRPRGREHDGWEFELRISNSLAVSTKSSIKLF